MESVLLASALAEGSPRPHPHQMGRDSRGEALDHASAPTAWKEVFE